VKRNDVIVEKKAHATAAGSAMPKINITMALNFIISPQPPGVPAFTLPRD
jgi:hypothetical protein